MGGVSEELIRVVATRYLFRRAAEGRDIRLGEVVPDKVPIKVIITNTQRLSMMADKE